MSSSYNMQKEAINSPQFFKELNEWFVVGHGEDSNFHFVETYIHTYIYIYIHIWWIFMCNSGTSQGRLIYRCKTLEVSQLVYAASMLTVPPLIIKNV